MLGKRVGIERERDTERERPIDTICTRKGLHHQMPMLSHVNLEAVFL